MKRNIDENGRVYFTIKSAGKLYKYYEDEKLTPSDVWIDISHIQQQDPERTGYATQKPKALLQRIIEASSRADDLVIDFFCGSGTTLAAATELGRRWIGVDLGRYAIHTTRKRLVQVQHELRRAGRPCRPFDVYDLGHHERRWWQFDRLKGCDDEYRNLVLTFYKADPHAAAPHPLLHGTRQGAHIHVDRIDGTFTFGELRATAEAARAAGGRELHCLAWDFEADLALNKGLIEAEIGLTIRLRYIPREIMELNRTEAQFFEAGYLEARPIRQGDSVDVELARFAPSLPEVPTKQVAALRGRAITSPFDFIDFWAVDFTWDEGKPFEHHWQDFRTRTDRSLKTRTDAGWKYAERGRHQICVKAIDVFGVGTGTVVEVWM